MSTWRHLTPHALCLCALLTAHFSAMIAPGSFAAEPEVRVKFYVPDADISTTTLQQARGIAIQGEAADRREAMEFFSWQARKYADTAVSEILHGLDDEDAGVRAQAAIAFHNLKSIPTEQVDQRLLDLWGRDRFAAAMASAYRGIVTESIARELLAGLARPEPFTDLAAGGFHVLGSSAAAIVLDDLVRLIDSKDRELSCTVLMVLAETRTAPPSLVPRMREWIRKGKYCDWQAAAVLGSIGPPAAEAVPDLVSRIHGKAGECCSWDVQYLVSIGTASIPALLPMAREKDEYRRAWASCALAQLAADSSVPLKVIDDALCDPSHEVVLRTKDGLTRAGIKTGRLAEFFDARTQEFRSKTCRGSYRPPAAGVPRGAVPPIDESALERDLVPKLISDLDGPERQKALRTLSELGPYAAAAIPKLLRDLPKAEQGDRQMIARMLGSIGAAPAQCVPALAELLKDSNNWTSDAAFQSLALFGDAAQQLAPAMLERLKTGKIYGYFEESFAALQGPVARAALPYYRSLSAEDDEGEAARGVRLMMLIAPGDAATRQAALAEAGRGSAQRRCLIASELLKALGDVPDVRNLPVLSDDSCRKSLEHQPGLLSLMSELPTKTGSSSYPHLKINLSLPKTIFYVGEPIEVTPNIPDWPQPSEKHPYPSFYSNGKAFSGLNLLPEIRTSSGVLVESGGVSDVFFRGPRSRRRGAELSSSMANMMANGMVIPRAGSVYAVGRPATVFIREPGLYKLKIPETVVHVKSSTGPLNLVSADPVDVKIIPATDAFVIQTLREIETELTSDDPMTRGWATERLRNLNDDRAIPILLRCLEDEYKNVLTPALLGLLEFSRPESVAREIRKAIGQGRPNRPAQIAWYAEILARTEHGWPGTDAHSRIRVDAESAKWRLLLERRQKSLAASVKLNPQEAIRALKDGFVSPDMTGICDLAWRGIAAPSAKYRDGTAAGVIAKCGNKRSIPTLWKIVTTGSRFSASDRTAAAHRLHALGDAKIADYILTDMAKHQPLLYHTTESLPVIKAQPKKAAEIIIRKLESGDPQEARFASDILWGMYTIHPEDKGIPFDYARMRNALLACQSCDAVTWGHVTRFLGLRSPKDSFVLIETQLKNRQERKTEDLGGALQVLAELPPDIGGQIVRRLLESSNETEAAAMAGGMISVWNLPHAREYFPDILSYFKRSSNEDGQRYAAQVMQRISHFPKAGFSSSLEPSSIDPETKERWVKAWENWMREQNLEPSHQPGPK